MTDEAPIKQVLASDDAAKAEAEAEAAAVAAAASGTDARSPETGAGSDRNLDRAGREPGELVVALSPRQIIGGFALLAGLIIMLRRRGRRKG